MTPVKLATRTGDAGDALYVILDGALQVVLGPNPAAGASVAVLNAGQIAGELEVMTKSRRVASLIAIEDTAVLEIQAAALDRLLAENRPAASKIVLLVARTLARLLDVPFAISDATT